MSVASEPPISHAVRQPARRGLPAGQATRPDPAERIGQLPPGHPEPGHPEPGHPEPGQLAEPGRRAEPACPGPDSAVRPEGHRRAGGTGCSGGWPEEPGLADGQAPQAAGERAERPRLLRVAELGPPPVLEAPVSGWRSELLARLPRLRPVPNVCPQGPQRAQERPAQALITDAEARGLAGSTARAVLEALEGRRPVRQLAAMLDDRATAAVRTMQLGGLRWPVRRAAIVAVHVFQPCREAVEAVVTFRCDQRTRVLAMRIDRVCRRWIVTAVRVG